MPSRSFPATLTTLLEIEQVPACMEATGTGRGMRLSLYLYHVGHTVSIVNPARMAAFRLSEGGRTKTVKQDAKMIAHCCAQKCLVARSPTLQKSSGFKSCSCDSKPSNRWSDKRPIARISSKAIYQTAAAADPDTAAELSTALQGRRTFFTHCISGMAEQLRLDLSPARVVTLFYTLTQLTIYQDAVRGTDGHRKSMKSG